jgi:hypothetical protein
MCDLFIVNRDGVEDCNNVKIATECNGNRKRVTIRINADQDTAVLVGLNSREAEELARQLLPGRRGSRAHPKGASGAGNIRSRQPAAAADCGE